MNDLITLIVNNGIGVVCVAYMIYFQSTSMKEMLKTLGSINERLILIEEKLGLGKWFYVINNGKTKRT